MAKKRLPIHVESKQAVDTIQGVQIVGLGAKDARFVEGPDAVALLIVRQVILDELKDHDKGNLFAAMIEDLAGTQQDAEPLHWLSTHLPSGFREDLSVPRNAYGLGGGGVGDGVPETEWVLLADAWPDRGASAAAARFHATAADAARTCRIILGSDSPQQFLTTVGPMFGLGEWLRIVALLAQRHHPERLRQGVKISTSADRKSRITIFDRDIRVLSIEAIEALVLSLPPREPEPIDQYGPIKLYGPDKPVKVFGRAKILSIKQYECIEYLVSARDLMTLARFETTKEGKSMGRIRAIIREMRADPDWHAAIRMPGGVRGSQGGKRYGIDADAADPER